MATDSVARILSLSSLQATQDIEEDLSNFAKLTDLQIGKEVVAQTSIGGIAEGTVYPSNTTLAKLIEDMLGRVVPPSEQIELYTGATTDIPTDISGLTKITGYDATKLCAEGLVKDIKVQVDPETEIGQYPVIAVGKEVVLSKWVATEFPLGPLSYNVIDKGEYNIYYLTSSTVFDINYTFEFTKQEA